MIAVYGPRAAHSYGSSDATRHACVSRICGRTDNGQGPDEDGANDDDHEDYCSPDVDGLSTVPHEGQYSDSDGNDHDADGDDERSGRTDKRCVK